MQPHILPLISPAHCVEQEGPGSQNQLVTGGVLEEKFLTFHYTYLPTVIEFVKNFLTKT